MGGEGYELNIRGMREMRCETKQASLQGKSMERAVCCDSMPVIYVYMPVGSNADLIRRDDHVDDQIGCCLQIHLQHYRYWYVQCRVL